MKIYKSYIDTLKSSLALGLWKIAQRVSDVVGQDGLQPTQGPLLATSEGGLPPFPKRGPHEATPSWAGLNVLRDPMAVLDREGRIIFATHAWHKQVAINAHPFIGCSVGMNYLEWCHKAMAMGVEGAHLVLQGTEAVLRRFVPEFVMEYAHPTQPGEVQQCVLTVTCLSETYEGAVVSQRPRTVKESVEQALERGDAEVERRVKVRTGQLEDAHKELVWLGEASVLLGASLDIAAVLDQVAQLMVPRLGELCIIDIVIDNGSLYRAFVRHADPAQLLSVQTLQLYGPSAIYSHDPVIAVVASGQPAIHTEISDEFWQGMAHDEAHREALAALNCDAMLIVPLATNERIIGTISVMRAADAAPYGPSDLTLAGEVARRAAPAIENAQRYSTAQAALREREALLSVAAHELKSPIITMQLYTEVQKRRIALSGVTTERRDQSALNVVHDQLARMYTLIESLLDVSRLQTDPFELKHEPISLTVLLRRLMTIFQVTFPEHPLQLVTPDDPLMISGDEIWLEQLFRNLIENAVKYSPHQTPIMVLVEYQTTRASISVLDEGIGIPKADLVHLFKGFYRGENASRQDIRGMGLGLYIARQVVDGHGGEISVASELDEGSTFTVTFPLIPVPSYEVQNT